MIIDIGTIDVKLLKQQAEVIGNLSSGDGYGVVNRIEEIEALEGVWNLLERIIDKVEKEEKQQIPARLMRVVQ